MRIIPPVFEKLDCDCCYVVDEVDLRDWLTKHDQQVAALARSEALSEAHHLVSHAHPASTSLYTFEGGIRRAAAIIHRLRRANNGAATT